MSKITVEIETPKKKRSTKGTARKRSTKAPCATPRKKRRATSKRPAVVTKAPVTKAPAKKATPRKKAAPESAAPPRKAAPPKAAPRRTPARRSTVGGFFRSLFTPRSSSLFRIKRAPYTHTPVERLDDGPRNFTSTLSDQSLRLGSNRADTTALTSAHVVRVKGEGYRLATGSPVFVRDGSIFLFGNISGATYDAGRYTYEVRVGRGVKSGVSEDDVTPIDDTNAIGLSDGPRTRTTAPDPEHAKIVTAMNKKFKLLKDDLEAVDGQPMFFVAYCGGKNGYMVRRYVKALCPTQGSFEAYRPIGMGPKGLEAHFQKKYGMSWTSFLEMPTDDVRRRLQKITNAQADSKKAATAKAETKKAKHAAKTARKATVAAKPKKAAPKPKAAPAPKPKKAAPKPKAAPKATPPAKKAPKMTTPKPAAPRPAVKPAPVVKTAAAPAASTSNLDAAEEGMKRLEALMAKAISA